MKNCLICENFIDCQTVAEVRGLAIDTNSEIDNKCWVNLAKDCFEFIKGKQND